jgi:hypothetical protein
MGSLIYACVAREGTVLSEHSAGVSGVSSVARDCLQRALQPGECLRSSALAVATPVPKPTLHPHSGQDRLTVVSQPHTINFLRREAFTFLVVADEALGRCALGGVVQDSGCVRPGCAVLCAMLWLLHQQARRERASTGVKFAQCTLQTGGAACAPTRPAVL